MFIHSLWKIKVSNPCYYVNVNNIFDFGNLLHLVKIYIWSSWCHCHPIISCCGKIQNGLSFWCWFSQVVLEKRPLNGCSLHLVRKISIFAILRPLLNLNQSRFCWFLMLLFTVELVCSAYLKVVNCCLCVHNPLPSNRHHRNNSDCLEGKRENYQVCSVQYCAQQLCTVQYTHIWTDLTVPRIGFCLTGRISLICMYYCNACIGL